MQISGVMVVRMSHILMQEEKRVRMSTGRGATQQMAHPHDTHSHYITSGLDSQGVTESFELIAHCKFH